MEPDASRHATRVGLPSAAPCRFPVDDVPVSTEVLRRADLLGLMRNKLTRGILVGPLLGRSVVDSGRNGPNPLVWAVHLAFSRHLPLTLSPDDIWLTIVQGFSSHVNEHSEPLRGRLVKHQGILELREKIKKLRIEEVTSAVSGFSRQIREATDPVLHETLLSDFTTTTPETRIASEVALMDTYSRFFKFSLMLCICGIPYVTLTGSPQDWRRIRDRAEVLETFGLDWWLVRLRPILDQFVRAAEGNPDREFWRGIYKFRPAKGPYDSERVTGWLVDLFPYLGDSPHRKRSHAFDPGQSREVRADEFPSGLCSVDVELNIVLGGQIIDTQMLNLVAGLLAVEQAEDYAVSPAISWCLTRQPPANDEERKALLSEMYSRPQPTEGA